MRQTDAINPEYMRRVPECFGKRGCNSHEKNGWDSSILPPLA